MYEPRLYRQQFNKDRFYSFVTIHRETDLWIGIDNASYVPEMEDRAYKKVVELRKKLDKFIIEFPEFEKSINPVLPGKETIPEAREMAYMATKTGIGPMATVAGLFAQEVGKDILKNFQVKELIIENGGDIFFQLKEDLVLSVYAGKSALSEKIGIQISALETPLGVCTSAGTVGPSLSFGKADAVMVACKNIILADALATAFGNKMKSASNIDAVLKLSEEYPEILSLVIICEGKVGIRSNFEVKVLK
ncbi:MAG: UPF0280 family protein [Mariniphaga sp.]|nr:UPF0280 family protein [Mariniphaga sp.]